MSASDYIYFGVDPACGHTVAAIVDDPKDKRGVAKTVAGFIRDGYTLLRQSTQDGIEWCNEDCPRMKQVRAEQATRADKRRGRR